MDVNPISPLEEACRIAGGSNRLAEKLSDRMQRRVSKASISRWKTERVPAEICPEIEALTGVACERLRPDVSWGVLRTDRALQAPPAGGAAGADAAATA